MRRSFWRALKIAALAALVAACATLPVGSAEPEPAVPEAEASPAAVEDSLGLLIEQVEESATTAGQPEAAAGVREPGADDGGAARSGIPTWDIPITMNNDVERWLEFFRGDGRENFTIYLRRAGRYEPMMRAILRDAGLPEDLVYISLIESGFSPRAYSRARAVGLWQFIASTGRLYDLQISYWVDERRDPILATKAAAAHLADLYAEFGSWYLAAAAYNGGPGRVRRSVQRSGSDDFWTLSRRRYLRRETRNYVPKLIAAALIAKQPEHYGFFGIETAEPMAYDVVQVPDATSLDVIADAAGVPVAQVMELNPQILRGVTPPGQRYSVRVPPGTGHDFALHYAQVAPSERVTWVQHVVRRGDTLSEIAGLYGVSVSAIRAANPGVRARQLRIGQRLIIPRAGRLPRYASATTVRRSVPVRMEPRPPQGPYVTYRVQTGDSLWAIAKRYEVTARDLMLWNGLTTSRIYPGDEVRIYVDSN
ncbi:MAG: LysM peptidoglycan-binding domain-containing protein [Gemmatimonadetes bacterium]|nr:LysM peptidoglycan-binding domain-containing protein [Gemmatimonadota bacterium]NIO32596.1 LysM peptidoglycan-binding domain-containing protein [Gemmatimonadota bacterium]